MGGINGIESVVYGVEDLDLCVRYFVDFGLPLAHHDEREAVFELAEGSRVIIRPLADALVEGQRLVGRGVQQLYLGVPDQKTLDRLVERLRNATEVSIDPDGTARFLDCDGISVGMRIYNKKAVWGAPDPINSFSNIQRRNVNRKWRVKALPKTIQHVVFQTPDPEASFAWYRDNLDFRLSDIQEGIGVFARASGTTDHHNLYWLKATLPGFDGAVRFNHVNYGVEDIDEVMVGANYMERRGWKKSTWGLGRHRIASSIFLYLPCPAGGEAEYGTDSDSLDDSWVPRRWSWLFGAMSFMHNLQPWIIDDVPWDVEFVEGFTPGKPNEPGADQASGDSDGSPAAAQGKLPDAIQEKLLAASESFRDAQR